MSSASFSTSCSSPIRSERERERDVLIEYAVFLFFAFHLRGVSISLNRIFASVSWSHCLFLFWVRPIFCHVISICVHLLFIAFFSLNYTENFHSHTFEFECQLVPHPQRSHLACECCLANCWQCPLPFTFTRLSCYTPIFSVTSSARVCQPSPSNPIIFPYRSPHV